MMMEQVLARENLLAAWRRVKANAGAPGIDGMTVEEFPAFSREHWPRIRSALMEGTYRPAPVRRVFTGGWLITSVSHREPISLDIGCSCSVPFPEMSVWRFHQRIPVSGANARISAASS